MVSKLCSTTTTVLPRCTSSRSLRMMLRFSSRDRPIEGSSSTYKTLLNGTDNWLATRMRCTSLGDNVCAGRDKDKCPNPNSSKSCTSRTMRSTIAWPTGSQACASSQSLSAYNSKLAKAWMACPCTVTLRASWFNRAPPQEGQVTACTYFKMLALRSRRRMSDMMGSMPR